MEKAEGHGIPIPTSSSPESDHDDFHPDSPPVGSPDVSGFRLSPPAVLSDDLRCKIIKQVEYYFSDENLPNDKFLLKYVTRNDGYVPIGVIASFRKMKKLTRDMSLIVAALKESSLVVVSSNGNKVKRLHPLPLADVKDPMVCTVLVENLPEDHSVENLYKVFGEVGKIENITIHGPNDVKEPKKCTVAEKLVSGKLHALVEYDTVEAAEKAVTLLNNKQDWRYGLRVKLLKKLSKAAQKKKNWKESDSEKCNIIQASENEENRDSNEQHESHDEETVDPSSRDKSGVHLAKEKNGHKARNHAPGRRQKHHGPNGHGHGTQFSSHAIEPSKPPPGPKMPDGTRGFAMGRGRPRTTN
ncbi:la-related protein 6A [Dorcoceras hygrometricum]|uniref:La-related protein 6A n=1 Tax=Dorcoceras hygrometricum TaxID=472368 RepID=A0A2Z7CYG7_9LAMI|nr:la-related protein 6A [Dorcoceras hygrometricum]